MMRFGSRDRWVDELDTNEHGRRVLSLDNAKSMAARGDKAGWYIAPFAMKWTIGRMAADREHYYVLLDSGEPVTFESAPEATRFLIDLVGLANALEARRDFAPPFRRASVRSPAQVCAAYF